MGTGAHRVLFICPDLDGAMHFSSALRRLARSHSVHILTESDLSPSVLRWEAVQHSRADGLTIGRLEGRAKGAALAQLSRGCLDIWRMESRLGPDATSARLPCTSPPALASVATIHLLRRKRTRAFVARILKSFARALPPDRRIVEQLRALSPDLVIVTPLTFVGSAIPTSFKPPDTFTYAHLASRPVGPIFPSAAASTTRLTRLPSGTQSSAANYQRVFISSPASCDDRRQRFGRLLQVPSEASAQLRETLAIDSDAPIVMVMGSDEASPGDDFVRIRPIAAAAPG